MKIEQFRGGANGALSVPADGLSDAANLVLVFGAPDPLSAPGLAERLRAAYPRAVLFGCSTAGEILNQSVFDQSLVVTAIAFDRATVQGRVVDIPVGESSQLTGVRLAGAFAKPGLRHLLVLSDGLEVNGSALVEGLSSALPAGVTVTGGLSADGAHFGRTLVMLDGPAAEGQVAAVGFYGADLRISHGCVGGWDPFGPERLVTRAEGNVLYELDGSSALQLYQRYLGEHAKRLPASGLLFPLLVRNGPDDPGVVRTILSVDHKAGALTFAGEIPSGATARMMKANFDRLIDGAARAAEHSLVPLAGASPELAVLISCVGRKLVLKQRTEEEVEAVRHVLGPGAALTGFYSYGEISPLRPGVRCGVHNQTMTVTTFSET